MKETNVQDWPQLEEKEFEAALSDMVLRAIRDKFMTRLAA